MSKNYKIQDYSIQELIQIFDLKTTPQELSGLHVQKAEEKFRLSQQKGKLTSESWHFFYQALHRLKQEISKPKRSNELQRSNKTNFNEKFNDMFENAVQSKQLEEKRKQRTQWFHVEEDPVIEKAKNIDEIHHQINKMRKVQNTRTEPVYTGFTCDRYSGDAEDDNDYKTSDPFSKNLKFDDIRRVHRDETVIPVELRENMPQISLKDYKVQRELGEIKFHKTWTLPG